jgi:predicted ATPase
MREKIHAGQYVMGIHAEEEMDEDGLTAFDVECGILTGEIVERQKDRTTGEWKYLVKGKSLGDEGIVVVGKLSLTGKLFIITVYLE